LEVLFSEKTFALIAGERSRVKRILEVLFPEKTFALIAGERSSAGPIFTFFYFYFSRDSTSILLFFRSTESPGKTRSVFTPPIFPSSLLARPYKPEGLSLETLSSQVLEFEGKAKANPIGAPFRGFLFA
jgi:hypothetical protein